MKGRASEEDGPPVRAPSHSRSSSTPPSPSPSPVPVLFLDVDGVLNTRASSSSSSSTTASSNNSGGFSVLHGSLLQRLATVLRVTNARVVLSSTWRLDAPSRERLRRRLCAEFFLSPPLLPLLHLESTPVISTAELLRLCRDKDQVVLIGNSAATTGSNDIPAVQRVREILKWIQQNQVPLQSTAGDTHSSISSASSSAASSTHYSAITVSTSDSRNNTSSSNSSSSNKHPSNPVAEQLAWVALDDLYLQGAASNLVAHASRHFVQTNPERGLSVHDAERLIELLSDQQQSTASTTEDGIASSSFSLRWSSVVRALQQRTDLLFVVDSRGIAAAAAATANPATCEPFVVVVVDTSTFQVIAALRLLDEAQDWVFMSDGVALFDDSRIAILEILDSSPSRQPAEDQVGEPEPLVWLRRRPDSLVKWSLDDLRGRLEHSPLSSGSSFASMIAAQLCREATASSGTTESHTPVGLSSSPPSKSLLLDLLTRLVELEAQQFDAKMAHERFSQCGFSLQQRVFLAANPSIAMNLLHLLPLANLQQPSSSSSSSAPSGLSNAKRSRYCELLLSICKLFPRKTQSVLRQHLGEYVARDELTSLAALEAVAFAVRCGDGGEDDDDAMILDQLDELICCY